MASRFMNLHYWSQVTCTLVQWMNQKRKSPSLFSASKPFWDSYTLIFRLSFFIVELLIFVLFIICISFSDIIFNFKRFDIICSSKIQWMRRYYNALHVSWIASGQYITLLVVYVYRRRWNARDYDKFLKSNEFRFWIRALPRKPKDRVNS